MQRIKKIAITLLFFGLFYSNHASAATYPAPSGFVNDSAKIISAPVFIQLTNIITQFEAKTGNEMAIATIPSLGNEPIENYAVGLYKAWGIGKKGEDNGLLLLVAPNDREIRIEVGYGLEQYINDALAGRIIRDTIIPHFRNGDFSLGILNGTTEITSIIAQKTGVEFDTATAANIDAESLYHINNKQTAGTKLAAKIFKVILIIFFILFFIKNPWAALFLLSSFGGGRGGSYRGGFGGGFGGFGGGLSGGGGASGRW